MFIIFNRWPAFFKMLKYFMHLSPEVMQLLPEVSIFTVSLLLSFQVQNKIKCKILYFQSAMLQYTVNLTSPKHMVLTNVAFHGNNKW